MVLILVCVEVSVGDYTKISDNYEINYVLILVCVEVSVGDHNSSNNRNRNPKS